MAEADSASSKRHPARAAPSLCWTVDASAVFLGFAYALVGLTGTYLIFLTMLTIPFVQNQVIYLNAFTMTWFKDLNSPEQWGFLHNQVTPFNLRTSDGETLHAWHILPLNIYRQHEQHLTSEPHGLVPDMTSRLSFRLLRDDPEARLILYLHGAGGTLGSGFRPPSYRAISAADPAKIHVLAVDYRGFGASTGSPSEAGLEADALALAAWAVDVVGIPPARIAVFGQSLGTAVGISLVLALARRPEPVLLSGMVLVAPFADVAELTATYRVAGVVPILGPVARFPPLLSFLNGFIRSKWPSKHRLTEFVRLCEGLAVGGKAGGGGGPQYQISILHAEDDYDIPWSHSETVFYHAVNGSMPSGISFEDLEEYKRSTKRELQAGGWVATRQTEKGLIREAILKHGLHDRIMSYPVVSLEVARALRLE
jgi:abhydrolase domain-containing protein 12